MHDQRSSLVATFSLLAGITGCAVAPDGLDDTSSAEQYTFTGDLGASLGSPVTTGNTIGASDDFVPSCVGFSIASDATYTWTAPAAGDFTFDTTGSLFDTVLEVRAFNTLASLGCNDDSGGTLQSTVTATLAAGQTVLVVVDGFGADAGQYRLSITPSGTVQDAPSISESERQAIDAAIARKHGQP